MKLPLLILLLALPMASMAHSGRTNSAGCHNNRSTGEYHCNHGGTTATSRGAPSQDVPSHWSKDVDVGPAPVARRPAYSCPVGTIASNLIIDQHPSTCARAVTPVVRPACSSCASACTVATCGRPAVAVRVSTPKRAKVAAGEHSFYFKNCEEAFTARRAPLHRGDDGYRAELDEDGDGMACDPMVMW